MMMVADSEINDQFGEGKCNISQIEPDLEKEDQNNFSRMSKIEIDNLLKREGVGSTLEH